MMNNPNNNEDRFQSLNQLMSHIAPGGDGSDTTWYDPTPRELAYGLYLLEHAFPSSWQLYNTSPQTGPISITGKDAVTFLTTSGIHRLILRILWTVVDPHNEGTLTQIRQLHTIVRLVALTQAGHVEPELLSVGTLPPPKPTPVQVVKNIMGKTMQLQVPLAKFNVVAVPNQQQLQQIYMLYQRTQQQQQPQLQLQQQQQQTEGLPDTPAGSWPQQQPEQPPQQPLPSPQGMAAFDALGGIQDAPLPSLGMGQPQSDRALGTQQQQPTIQPASSFPGVGPTFNSAVNAFGGLLVKAGESLQHNAQVGQHQQHHPPAPQSGVEHLAMAVDNNNTQMGLGPALVSTGEFDPVDDDDEFGGFSDAAPQVTGMAALDTLAPVANAPLPGLTDTTTATSATPPPPIATPPDEFGGFAGAAHPEAVTTGMAALDALGPTENAPLPALASQPQPEQPPTQPGETSQPPNQNDNEEDEFGGFTTVATPAPAPEVTGMSALDALGPTENAPLPSLSQPPITKQPEDKNEEDEFGGFADAGGQPEATGIGALDALGPIENAPLSSLTTTEDEFGGFENAAPNESLQEAGGLGALDALGAVENAPLPALGGMYAQDQQKPTVETANDDEDDFGGFEEAASSQPSQQPDATGLGALDALGPVENSPLPALGQPVAEMTNNNNDDKDEFSGFNSATQQIAETAQGDTDDQFGGFNDAPQNQTQQQPSEKEAGVSAFDALAGVQDAFLPASGMGQPLSERGLGTTPPMPAGIKLSLSFPGADANTIETSGMSAFDALAPAQDAPLPSLPNNSGSDFEGTLTPTASADEDQNNMSFGSFTDAENKEKRRERRRSGGTLRRKSSKKSLGSPDETAPKDLMPTLPGSKYVETVRRNSLRKLPELNDDDLLDEASDHEDPFAGLDPAPGTAPLETSFTRPTELNDPAPLSPGSEKMPVDLQPDLFGKHYVPHSKDASQTPGGLETLADEDADEDEDFGGFEEAPKLPLEETPGFETMPHELTPHAPGEHYVPHGLNNQETPFGLETVGEVSDSAAGSELHPHLRHLNPPTALSRQETPMPHDLKPHLPGDHYVPHSPRAKKTPGGLPTVGESLEEISSDPFGDFAQASAGNQSVPPPVQLSRQATPAAQDLQQVKRTVNTTESATIFEEEEEESFGDFAAANSMSAPPPVQLSRQPTPAVQDLAPLTVKASAGPLASAGTIQEGEEGEGGEDDDFGDFAGSEVVGTPGQLDIAPPVQMKRMATPRPQDLRPDPPSSKEEFRPDPPGQHSPKQAGLGNISESLEEQKRLSLIENDAVDNPFQGFHHMGDSIAPPTQLSRQATPAVKELQPITRKVNVGGSATIFEEDDVAFGSFEAGTASVDAPPPSQLSRQATPAAQDLAPITGKAASGGALGGMAITEEEECNDGSSTSSRSPDPFQAFDDLAGPQKELPPLSTFIAQPEANGGNAMAAAPALKPQQSLELFAIQAPLSRQASNDRSITRLGSRSTTSLLDDDESDDDDHEDDAIAQHRSITPPPNILYSLQKDGAPAVGDEAGFTDFEGFAGAEEVAAGTAPTRLSRQATPAAQDLDPLTMKPSSAVNQSVAIQEEDEEEEDEFGEFGDFSGATPAPVSLSRQATPAVQDLQPLGAKKKAVPESATIHEEEMGVEEDEFGDFGDFTDAAGEASVPQPTQLSRQATPAAKDLLPLQQKVSATPLSSAAISEEEEEDDSFGAFAESSALGDAGQAEVTEPSQPKRRPTPLPKDLRPALPSSDDKEISRLSIVGEDLGEITSDTAVTGNALAPPPQLSRQATPAVQDLKPLTQKSSAGGLGGAAVIAEEEDFGDFGSFEQADETKPQPAESAPEEDDFGDFGSFEQANEPPTPAATASDDFGDFAAAAAAPAAAPSDDDDFGDFEAFSSAPSTEGAKGDSGGGWDAFQAAPASSSEPVAADTRAQLRGKIIALSQRLPSPFSDAVDYGKAFDKLIGTLSGDESKNQAERCVQVLSLLSSSHSKLVGDYWMQVLGVARDELALGDRLLDQASSLTKDERKIAQKPLETMVAGMGEFVRTTRSIVASIGDMMFIAPSTPFNEAALDPSWGSMPIIQKGLEIERLWKTIMDKSSKLGLAKLTRLETMVEIRMKCLSRCPSTTLCQLSLQPLSEEDNATTKATVDWGGKTFMACSANMLANKCSFYSV